MRPRLIALLILLAIVAVLLLPESAAPPGVYAQDDPDAPEPYTTGVFPRAMAYDGQRVWVANWLDNSITVLDAETGEHIITHDESVVGKRPIALAWDGTGMWVASYLDNQVYRLTVNGERRETFGSSQNVQRPVALLYDGAHIWVVNQGTGARPGTVMKIVADTALLLDTYEVGHFPTAITWDGSAIWVANGGDNTITVLSDDTGVRVGQVNVADFPISLAFDGQFVWASHYDGTIMRIRNNSREVDESVTLDTIPGRPITLLYAFERVWISNVDDESVAAFRAIDGVLADTELTGEFPASIVTTDNEVWVANWLNYTIDTINGEELLSGTVNEPEAVATNVSLWLPSPEPTATFTPTPIPVCNPEMPSRLKVGDRGQVDDEGSRAPLRLRSEPGVLTEETEIDLYPPLTAFVVLEGPRCVDGDAWFKVRLDDDTEGWFIEALGDDWTIEPLEE